MNASEFMKRLDSLYEAMDLLDEKLVLRTDSKVLSLCAHNELRHKVNNLIKEYFMEKK